MDKATDEERTKRVAKNATDKEGLTSAVDVCLTCEIFLAFEADGEKRHKRGSAVLAKEDDGNYVALTSRGNMHWRTVTEEVHDTTGGFLFL